jgi:benzil reductase ((S)-benzoin forming)
MNDTLVIISGTTQGLGKELALVFNKFNVLTINRKDIGQNNIVLDLSSKKINLDNLEKYIKQYSQIVFISNASTINPIKNIKLLSEIELENSIFTNYINPSKIILSIIRANKKYVILNITSGAAFTTNEELSMYSASKAAMHRFVDILKREENGNEKALLIENFDPGRINTKMQFNLLDKKNISKENIKLNTTLEIANKIYDLVGKYI